MSTEIVKARQSAVRWLTEQMVPNAVVPIPAQYRRRLILSYRIPPDHSVYPYLSRRSFIYDNALAVIAFTMVKDFRRAEYILGALNRLLTPEGSLWFAYNTHNSWPSKQDNHGAIKRLGTVAWAGYAAVYYLGQRLEEQPSFLAEDSLAKDYLEFSEKIASFVISKQILDNRDKRYGLITGGEDTYVLKTTEDGSGIQENFKDEAINWVSMEHNIDAYFFLRDLGRLTKKNKYLEKADLIKKGLQTLWTPQSNQLYRGMSQQQQLDQFLPLDGASWGALFFLAIGDNKKAQLSLKATDNFYNRSNGLEGYSPYFKETIYEGDEVNQFYYPENPGKTWKEVNLIWGEGSLGVAVAYIRAGNIKKGLTIIKQMMLMEKDGGFKYASINIPYQFTDFPSVASTAWFVIASEIYLNQDDLFWGK